MTRTWTLRQNNTPDWLLWVRRAGPEVPGGTGSTSQADIERATDAATTRTYDTDTRSLAKAASTSVTIGTSKSVEVSRKGSAITMDDPPVYQRRANEDEVCHAIRFSIMPCI